VSSDAALVEGALPPPWRNRFSQGAGTLSQSWSPGLRILPGYDLLTGAKIPRVTPNIIDVRIVRQQVVVADFPSAHQETGD
jgi:hypothetical protein